MGQKSEYQMREQRVLFLKQEPASSPPEHSTEVGCSLNALLLYSSVVRFFRNLKRICPKTHCNDTIPKCATNIPRNETAHCAALFPISTFMYLICSKLGGRILGIYKLLKYMNVEIGKRERTVSFLGIHKSDLVCSADNF